MGDIPLNEMINVNAIQLSSWGGEFSLLKEDVQNYFEQGYCVVVFAGTERSADALAGDLRREKIPASWVDDVGGLTPGAV